MIEKVCREILVFTRNELYLKMRFLDVALSSLPFIMDTGAETMGTDGETIFYAPSWVGGIYRQDSVLLNRTYLHMVLHCIFKHMLLGKGREKALYHLSCEIAVESIIDSMQYRCLLKPRSVLRRETYRKLSGQMEVLTAYRVYEQLKAWELSQEQYVQLFLEFSMDNHDYWPKEEEKKKRQEIQNKWQEISEQMETDMETVSKDSSSSSGHLIDQIKVENKERFQYRDFLKKFSVLREEAVIDEDSFDYGFYSYGLSLYGNMPLIEPQEWKETKKIEDFVIVIDTSMSCSGEVVRLFLEETYSVLSENESFFRKVNIHIIQCDDTVQSDQKIENREELKAYMENLTLMGEGGTDFEPAFIHVDDLIKKQEFHSLRGLIYFTDGHGTYPAKKPAYDTVFVFWEEADERKVPPWAMKLILGKEELQRKNDGQQRVEENK